MPSTFRYWGIAVSARADGTALSNIGSGATGFGNIEFASSYNGPNLAYGLPTFTTGSYQNGGGQCQAFDGSYGNATHTVDGKDHNMSISTNGSNTVPIYIWCDFGQPTTIVRCVLSATEQQYAAGTPSAYSIVGSNDATTWTTVWTTPPKTTWVDIEPYVSFDPTYAIPSYTGTYWGAHRYWRVIWGESSNNGGTNVALTGLQFRTTAGVAQINSGGTPIGMSSSYVYQSASPSVLFDTNYGDIYATSGSNSYSGWVGYDFGSPISVVEVATTTRGDGYYWQAPKMTVAQWSDDGATWTTASWMYRAQQAGGLETSAFLTTPVIGAPSMPAVQMGKRCGSFTLSSTPPTAAYSLRRLGSYDGPLIRVVSPFLRGGEVDIGSDTDGALDVRALASIANGGAAPASVTKWYDQSGNGYDAAPIPGGGIGSGYLNLLNGRPVLYFSYAILDAYGWGFASGPFTAIGMVNLTQTNRWPTWLNQPTNSGGNGASLGYTDSYMVLDLQRNGSSDTRSPNNLAAQQSVPHVVSWTSTAGIDASGNMTANCYLNGADGGSVQVGGYGQPLARLRIGASFQNATSATGDCFYGAQLGEILLWNSVIPDRAQVEQRVAQWYNVSAVSGYNTIDSGHDRLRRRGSTNS